MAFNINDFVSNVNESGGVAQQHTFMVRILPPAASSGNPAVTDFYRHLSFRCDATVFPGRAIQLVTLGCLKLTYSKKRCVHDSELLEQTTQA